MGVAGRPWLQSRQGAKRGHDVKYRGVVHGGEWRLQTGSSRATRIWRKSEGNERIEPRLQE